MVVADDAVVFGQWVHERVGPRQARRVGSHDEQQRCGLDVADLVHPQTGVGDVDEVFHPSNLATRLSDVDRSPAAPERQPGEPGHRGVCRCSAKVKPGR
jgi:hypothetical protein